MTTGSYCNNAIKRISTRGWTCKPKNTNNPPSICVKSLGLTSTFTISGQTLKNLWLKGGKLYKLKHEEECGEFCAWTQVVYVSTLAVNKWDNMQQKLSVRKLNTKYISAQQMPNDDLHAVFTVWCGNGLGRNIQRELNLPLKLPQKRCNVVQYLNNSELWTTEMEANLFPFCLNITFHLIRLS